MIDLFSWPILASFGLMLTTWLLLDSCLQPGLTNGYKRFPLPCSCVKEIVNQEPLSVNLLISWVFKVINLLLVVIIFILFSYFLWTSWLLSYNPVNFLFLEFICLQLYYWLSSSIGFVVILESYQHFS